jgi:hypothetical protein
MLAGAPASHSQVPTSASEARAFASVISDVANGSKRGELHFEWKRSGWLPRSGRLSSSAAETEIGLWSRNFGGQRLMMGQHAVIVPRCGASVGVTSRSRVSLPAFGLCLST